MKKSVDIINKLPFPDGTHAIIREKGLCVYKNKKWIAVKPPNVEKELID